MAGSGAGGDRGSSAALLLHPRHDARAPAAITMPSCPSPPHNLSAVPGYGTDVRGGAQIQARGVAPRPRPSSLYLNLVELSRQ